MTDSGAFLFLNLRHIIEEIKRGTGREVGRDFVSEEERDHTLPVHFQHASQGWVRLTCPQAGPLIWVSMGVTGTQLLEPSSAASPGVYQQEFGADLALNPGPLGTPIWDMSNPKYAAATLRACPKI